MSMTEKEYLEQSGEFNSTTYHADKVPPQELDAVFIAASVATQWADRVKRALFYGTDIEPRTSHATHTEVCHDPELAHIVHGVIGMFTEAGEMMAHLYDVMRGSPVDRVNLIEELGDSEWYAACLHRYLNSTPTEAREVNIAKLSARYPGKVFSKEHAVERDLASERAVLESTLANVQMTNRIVGDQTQRVSVPTE